MALNVQHFGPANLAIQVQSLSLFPRFLSLQSPYGSDRTPEESGKAVRIYIVGLLFFHPWRRKCNPL